MTTVARRREHDSGDYSDASHQENDQDTSGNGVQNDESDYDSAASDSERSERDPENQETERRVDDDEDRSNPQYIPKRGTFYEHDDRTAASGGEESTNTVSETASEKKEGETPSERRRAARKSETVNKWSHDKYNENEQMPKSRDELVAIYGYDIRNEDAPPHARRNRRYGRGPNKYTRTWEDEEAYKRQANAALPVRKPPNPEDFPELEAGGKGGKRVPRPRSKSQPSSTESIENGTQLRRNASIKDRARTRRPPARTPAKDKKETRDREGQKENREMPPLENLTITATVVNNSQTPPVRKINATVAQQRPVPTEQGKKKPPPPALPQPAAPNKSPPQSAQQQKPQTQQPSGPQEARGSKRYSSLRQRPLDTYSPPHQQHQQSQQNQQHRYHGDYPAPTSGQQTNQHQGSPAPQLPHPQQLMQQMHRNPPANQQHGPSPPHQPLPQQQLPQQPLPQQQLPQQPLPQPPLPQPPQIQQQQQLQQQQIQQQQISQQQQVRLGILEQQQMVPHPHHAIHNMPPQVPQHPIGQLQPAQAYAPPAMMPAQYMQQGVSGAAFSAAPIYAQPPPAPYPHQLYQHHNYVSSAGGVTYYSCAEQETLPRAQRRPTAAIPIVRPAAPDRPANSSEKDNIDRIVENMFVRKPWPSSHSADSKEKSETRNSQEPQSKESSQPNSLTSSSISTDSKPSESIEKEKELEKEPAKEVTEIQKEEDSTPAPEEDKEVEKESEPTKEESISTEA